MRRIIAALAFTGLFLVPHAGAAPIVIKFSHVVAEQTPKGLMALRFKELVEQRLKGKVVVEVYPDSKLFSDEAVIDALLRGEAQMAAPSLSKFGAYTRKLDLFDLPFLFNDLDAVDRFEKGAAGQQLLLSMEDRGIVGLGYLHNGMKQFSANQPLRTPADAKGLKFRIQSSAVLSAQFEALGATAVKKPFSEVHELLRTRAVDGAENPWSNIYSKNFHEVQTHITESNHGVLDYMVVTSSTFWNGLPAEVRDAVKEALDESIVYGNQVALDQALGDRQKVIDSGRCKVIRLTLAERSQWVTTMVPVWHRFEPAIGAELINAALEANRAGVGGKRKKRKKPH